MKKPQKRATEPKGKWAQYDEFDGIDLSFPWLVICLILLGIGVILCFTSIIVGGVWCGVMITYLYRLIRNHFRQKKLEGDEVVDEEEKPPYHIMVAMEQERKQAEIKAQEQAEYRAKLMDQLEEQKKSGLIGQKEYDRRRKELLQED